MYHADLSLSYSVGVFIVVLISGCVLNLLRRHYIFQLAGIAFFFTYLVFRLSTVFQYRSGLSSRDLYLTVLPMLTGVSACLISMVFGFWIFPPVRKKFKR